MLVVGGGASFPDKMPWEGGKKVWHDRVWVLDLPGGAWRQAGKLPRPLAYGVSATWRDSVICVGGSDTERHHAEAFRVLWNGAGIEIVSLPALPRPLSGAGGALVGDTLFVAGGSESPGEKAASDGCLCIDLSASAPAWRQLPSVPTGARLLPVASSAGETFHLLGGAALARKPDGQVGRVYLREAWSFTLEKGWRRLADLPKPIVAAPSPAPVVNGRILLIAGDDASRVDFKPVQEHPGFPPDILAYDIASDRWSVAGKTPAPRATVPVVAWGGGFVIPSGEVRPGRRSPEVWMLTAK